jgi:RNAse (barnase) inhibitor barstar
MGSESTLDVSGVSTPLELHLLLARHFSFPEYYGHNWDAFWDCVRNGEACPLPERLTIHGMVALEKRLPREAELFRQCLSDLVDERPEFTILVA